MHSILGRIILYVGERHSIVASRIVVRALVSIEVFVLLEQSTGIRMATSVELPLLRIAKTLLVVGFSVQLASLALFFRSIMICEFPDAYIPVFLSRVAVGSSLTLVSRFCADKDRAKTKKKPDRPWIRCCRTLYIGESSIIVFRITLRR